MSPGKFCECLSLVVSLWFAASRYALDQSWYVQKYQDEEFWADLEFPGHTSNKKLLVTKGIATRSKNATSSSWPYY